MSALDCEFKRWLQHMLGLGEAIASACQFGTNRKWCCSLVILTRACATSDRR